MSLRETERLPFVSHNAISDAAFELIHLDIGVPFILLVLMVIIFINHS